MASDEVDRMNWTPELTKFIIDKVLEDKNATGKKGGNLTKSTCNKIVAALKNEKRVHVTNKQVKNRWDYLKKKYEIWSRMFKKPGRGYNPVTNTFDWPDEVWDEYLKANPDARQFRNAGLQFANELRALFDDVVATGEMGWGPSKEGMPEDVVGSSNNTPAEGISQVAVGLDLDVPITPLAQMPLLQEENPRTKPVEKRRKKDEDVDIRAELQAFLDTMSTQDGPSIEQCNKILDERTSLTEEDDLYAAALAVFCENKHYREQWVKMELKPENLKLKWLTMLAKKHGYISA
ncbi:PREDICTED: uncharacterized protein At2g29880-like isoform X2 [Nelumbo nucifera]|uniref:Uncharacterized protein At2g29880-like isoform X2 n=1 Tax=Nelumbo nucifera TaxID=4432 RepID=A0A1U8BHP8_NELNU|nr:PREDICTED: uncharacterized protein At2g29880-like isoform X2 [Nelumbo nucifera]XP_010276165.1 PREDICTED: uncharacterized protein At2g29880-like isoform X2 [Nelumbo nucifera]XP_010276166.1 PREDICTED: uncharacterized protein At2g29880-like isoform X2 [Nelumbo nucifera]XP_010276167.1 PREDICTED: uncharacterized protein At2g29880-like isoform X2 [Nelumbo nucifera]